MAEPVNLNRVRKARARAAETAAAAANRVRHGRTKTEKLAARNEAEAARKRIDGAKLEP